MQIKYEAIVSHFNRSVVSYFHRNDYVKYNLRIFCLFVYLHFSG